MADGEEAHGGCAGAGRIVPRRRTPIAQLDRPFAHVISQGFQHFYDIYAN